MGCPGAEFGAWYPRFAVWDMHTPWERYQKDMALLLDQRLRSYTANVLWRAYGPTHFGTDLGAFTGATGASPQALPSQTSFTLTTSVCPTQEVPSCDAACMQLAA